jgi:hypothetical protein
MNALSCIGLKPRNILVSCYESLNQPKELRLRMPGGMNHPTIPAACMQSYAGSWPSGCSVDAGTHNGRHR